MSPEKPWHVLVVEDDPPIRDVIEYALKNEGCTVTCTDRGRQAIRLIQAEPIDMVILDVGLPDIDGFEVCREIRKSGTLPVLFLSSRSDEVNRVVGLEIGGDDYLTKPFSPRELVARIKAIRRRITPSLVANPAITGSSSSGRRLIYGPVEVDFERVEVRCGGREVALTRQELRLLDLLISRPGRVFSRDEVLERAWGEGGLVTDRTIDVHVKTLRKKFAPFEFIETVRGAGYRARDLSVH